MCIRDRSYLNQQEQRDLLETIESEDATPSLSQAIRMRKLSEAGQLDMDGIFHIMSEVKGNQKEYILSLIHIYPAGQHAENGSGHERADAACSGASSGCAVAAKR